MAFSFFFGFIAFVVQLYVLCAYADRFRKLPCLSLLLMEVLPLGGAVYYAVRRPEVPYLGWQFGGAVCLMPSADAGDQGALDSASITKKSRSVQQSQTGIFYAL